MALHTDYLPAERDEPEKVARQAALWTASDMATLAAALPLMLVASNRTRQIVYANHAFLEFMGLPLEEVVGLRPGEALGCRHALEHAGGCGTTRFCRFCGMAKAVATGLDGGRDTQECRISRGPAHQFQALNLQAWTAPVQVDGEGYVVTSLLDVYREKRLKIMERLFFHDVLNSASGVCNLAELMHGQARGELLTTTEMILAASARLQDQIMAQRDFVLAEDGDMSVAPSDLAVDWVLDQTANFFQGQAVLGRASLVVERQDREMVFSSDPSILLRVLVNLVKNALEASKAGQLAVLSASGDPDGVTFAVRNVAVMSEEVQSQVFKRMFSTKGAGRGIGSYGAKLLTERYLGGQIWFSSTAEEGTTFHVWLPLAFPGGSGE